MCGIAGVYLKDPDYISSTKAKAALETFVDNLFLGIESRGRDATGFVAVTFGNKVKLHKDALPAADFLKIRNRVPSNTRSILLHTRFATQGHQSNWANNHPVAYEDVFTTHNGLIRNDDALFLKHDLKRHAEVDTEIIPALLSKYGFEDPTKAFEELRGGFATANIRPMKNKGTVLLAKGPTYPLVTYNTDKFLVWASTRGAIESAYKALYGEAPSIKGWTTLYEGDLMWLSDDGVVHEKKAFKSEEWSHSHTQSYSDTQSYNNWESMYGPGYRSPSTTTSVVERTPGGGFRLSGHAKAIIKVRAEGKGLAFTWNDKIKNGGVVPLEIARMHNGKWHLCMWCNDTVIDRQTVKAPTWGQMCIDCFAIKTNNHPGLPSSEAPVPDVVAAIDVEELETYVEVESRVNAEALITLSAIFHLSPDAVDYVLNRLSTDYINNDDGYLELYAQLEDAYVEAEAIAWGNYAKSFEDTASYVSCGGVVHKKDEPCDTCSPECGVQAFSEPTCGPDNAGKECRYGGRDRCDGKWCKPTELQRFSDAGEMAEGQAKARMERQKAEEEEALSVGDMVSDLTANSTGKRKCMVTCRRNATIFRGQRWAWCKQHHDKCNTKGCKAGTIGWNPQGLRKCHQHLRRVKGAYFDGDTERIRREARVTAKSLL